MSRPMAETTKRRPRRQFDEDFKAQAVRLVVEDGKSVGAVARDLDLTESALRHWVERARADRSGGRTGLGDTTEFVIGSSARLYLAAIMDLHSRFIVGWALSAVNDRHLTLSALEKALKRRCPEAGLLHHSDQGCTYASEDYRTRLAQHGITCSMSRRGNCYDNAVMESWFSTVKSEESERFESYAHAKEALFDYIEVFYNQRRRHSTLGQISPAEFERRAAQAA